MKKNHLTDVQNSKDSRGIDLQKVGVKNVKMPLNILTKNSEDQITTVSATMSVGLPRHFKGTHMSRFIEILNEWRSKKILSIDLEGCLKETLKKLNASTAYLKLEFKYFIPKKAPVSNLIAPNDYDCEFEGIIEDNEYKFYLTVYTPITTLCPCSKEISEFGAHNQRAMVKVKLSYDPNKIIWIEDLVELIESCGSSPIFPILKRDDEKFVTEAAYKNPKFVEDVIRDLVHKIKNIELVDFYEIECEAFESIHNHSAWAYQTETIIH